MTGDTELEDIHGKFVIWFLWGFIMSLAPCAAALLGGIAHCIHEAFGKFIGSVLSCGMACGGLAWWITGIVWRFKASGSYASADQLTETERAALPEDPETLYQYRSGNFMLIYYIIVWSLIGCSVLSSLIGLIVSCTCMKA